MIDFDTTNFRGRLLTKEEVSRQCDSDGTDRSAISWDDFEQEPAIESSGKNRRCGRCGNEDTEYFEPLPSQLNGYYCLNCLQMGRIATGEQLYWLPAYRPRPLDCESCLTWQGNLSDEQSRVARELVDSLSDSKVHLVHAVTGAGKTEMIFQVVDKVLCQGGRVGLASPRIDVCLELYPRIQAAFERTAVSLLYGDMDETYCYTSLVVLTTHQLLRFKAAFDLLIVDEVDAFPYVGDESLHFATQRALKDTGKLIYLTATPDANLRRRMGQGELTSSILPARFHRRPLPEPEFIWVGDWRRQISTGKGKHLIRLVKDFMALDGVKLLFMPSIPLAEQLYHWLKHLIPDCRFDVVHAKDPNRKQKVQALRDGQLEALVSTTILERGVTFTHCHVLIMGAESTLYSSSALVQMSGRVGRKMGYESGRLIYAHYGKSRAMMQARAEIVGMNRIARERGLLDDTK